MKQYQKIYLLFFLLLFATTELIFAQSGDSCSSALTIPYTPGTFTHVSFENREHIWLTFFPDTPGVEIEISPDDSSDYANIESIDLYYGNDCSTKTLLWSQEYFNADSLQLNRTIRFELPEAGLNYFLNVNRMAGYGNGFMFIGNPPVVMQSCAPVCPNIISNPSFSVYDAGCLNNANAHQCPDPFNQGCICAWKASHGTPIFTFSTATMGVLNNTGEGIYQDLIYHVQNGRAYFFAFDYMAYFPLGTINFNAELGNIGFNAGTCFEPIPSPNWAIPNTPVMVNSSVWKSFATCFSSPGMFSRIRFYPTTNSNYKEWVGLDKVVLIELNTPMPNQLITCNESALLSQSCPSTDPRIHYLWSTGETTGSIWVSPTVNTQYTLTVSVVVNNQTLCSYIIPTTVVVLPLPEPVLTNGNTAICNPTANQSYCFNSNGALQYNFTVNPSNPTVVNGNCVDVQWSNLAGSCGTIEVTAIANTCTTSQSFEFCMLCQGNPGNFTWCDATASAILADPQYASYITGGNVFKTPPGKWVTIHGTFTVDVPFTFDNSDVRFGQNAKVAVNVGQVFEVRNNSHLHSCDGINMWDGIYGLDVSSLIYIHDGNNLIEDAKNAVVSDLGGNFEINATTFNNNYIGILVNTFWSPHPGTVYGTTFTGTGTLLSPYNGYCTMNYPACGIRLLGVKQINIGEPSHYATYGRNIFQNMLSGIYANGSGMNVYASEFRNMFDPPGNCLVAEGKGIYAKGNTLFYSTINIGNQAVSEKCIFNSCSYGIQETYNFSGKIQYNDFTNCDYPISNLYSDKYSNLVKGNVFDNFKRGIYFFHTTNNLQNGLEISENIFNSHMTSFSPSTYAKEAINVSNAFSTSANLWVIGNLINYSQTGIIVRNVWEPCNIRDNTINFDITPANALSIGIHHGIDSENDKGLHISKNNIIWRNQSFVPSGFINFMNGISVNYSSNTVSNTGSISENKIGPYPAANTGSTYGMGSGINISSDCMGLALTCNKLTRCEQGVTFNHALLGEQGSQDILYNWYSNGNTFKYTPAQGGIYRIAGSVFQPVHWAYINAIEDPAPFQILSIIPEVATYASFHCAPPLALIEEERDDNFGMLVSEDDPGLNPDYSGYEEQIKYAAKEKFYSAVIEDPAILDAGVPEDAAYEELFEELDNSNIARIQDIKTSIDSLDYTQAAQKLSTLVDSNLIEHNKKVVMEVYLQTIASEAQLDSNHIALLEPITLMHPLIGGEGVFWACAMLDKPVNNILPQLRKAKPHSYASISLDLNFSVYPNPAKDVLHVQYNPDILLTMTIADVTGKIIFSDDLDSKQGKVEINTSAIEAGTYFLKVMKSGEVVFSEKLLIIR